MSTNDRKLFEVIWVKSTEALEVDALCTSQVSKQESLLPDQRCGLFVSQWRTMFGESCVSDWGINQYVETSDIIYIYTSVGREQGVTTHARLYNRYTLDSLTV